MLRWTHCWVGQYLFHMKLERELDYVVGPFAEGQRKDGILGGAAFAGGNG